MHSDEKIILHCIDCNEELCKLCFTVSHNNHEIQLHDQETTQSKYKRSLAKDKESVAELSQMVDSKKVLIDKNCDLIRKHFEKQNLELESMGNLIKKEQEIKNLLQKTVSQLKMEQHSQMESKIIEYENLAKTTEESLDMLIGIKQKSATELLNLNFRETLEEFNNNMTEIENLFDQPLLSGNKVYHQKVESDFSSSLREVSLDQQRGSKKTKIIFLGSFGSKKAFSLNFDTLEFEELNIIDNSIELLDNSVLEAISESEMVLTGGCTFIDNKYETSNSAYKVTLKEKNLFFDCLPASRYKRFSHGSHWIGNELYLVGGYDGEHLLRKCEKLSIKDHKWTDIAEMNVERELFSSVALDDRFIYVFGGFVTENLDIVERYSVDADKWAVLDLRLETKIQSTCALAISSSQILIMGGYNKKPESEVFIFDHDKEECSYFTRLNTPRFKARAGLANNSVVILGGEESNKTSIEVINLDTCEVSMTQKVSPFKSCYFWSSCAL